MNVAEAEFMQSLHSPDTHCTVVPRDGHWIHRIRASISFEGVAVHAYGSRTVMGVITRFKGRHAMVLEDVQEM